MSTNKDIQCFELKRNGKKKSLTANFSLIPFHSVIHSPSFCWTHFASAAFLAKKGFHWRMTDRFCFISLRVEVRLSLVARSTGAFAWQRVERRSRPDRAGREARKTAPISSDLQNRVQKIRNPSLPHHRRAQYCFTIKMDSFSFENLTPPHFYSSVHPSHTFKVHHIFIIALLSILQIRTAFLF